MTNTNLMAICMTDFFVFVSIKLYPQGRSLVQQLTIHVFSPPVLAWRLCLTVFGHNIQLLFLVCTPESHWMHPWWRYCDDVEQISKEKHCHSYTWRYVVGGRHIQWYCVRISVFRQIHTHNAINSISSTWSRYIISKLIFSKYKENSMQSSL